MIRLHSFVICQKRYIQIESQAHHITAIFKKIMYLKNLHRGKFTDVGRAYYESEEDGTITFYQAKKTKTSEPGIWTYLVYKCPKAEEQVFHDLSIDTNLKPLKKLLAGQKLSQVTLNIKEYLKYKYNECEYLDVHLPSNWNTQEGRKISYLLIEELQAFKASSVFAEDVGKQYKKAVLDGFIKVAQEVLETHGTVDNFESAQYDVLTNIKMDDVANLIIEYNDYRIWQTALPSKSKAVEYAFNTALSYMSRIK